MTEEKFKELVKVTLKGRYVPLMEYNKYFNFAYKNDFSLEAIYLLIHFCCQIKGSKIRYEYIRCCLEEYLSKGLKTASEIRPYLILKKHNDSPIINKDAALHNYSNKELNSLFTKFDAIQKN